MPAPRYVDWTHIKVVGDDLGAAAPYVNEARKLMGYVQEDAARRGLGVHSMRRKLEDGTVIIAEKHGDIPRMTIAPAQRPGQTAGTSADDFVVWARSEGAPVGVDLDHPQQILRPPGTTWRTFFFNDAVAGFESFGRPKGTYAGRFTSGVRYAGNIDWCGEQSERLSWHGPMARYWYDRWRQPGRQYGTYVYALGQVLLDVDQYCIDTEVSFTERLVLGAARSGMHLYVVHASIPAAVDPPVVPLGRGGDVFMTPPFPTGTVQLSLRRYALIPSGGGALAVQVATSSHEQLWTHSGAGLVNPWFFSPDASRAETHAMPAQLAFHRYEDDVGGYDYVVPSSSHDNHRLEIDGTDVVYTAVQVSIDLLHGAAEAPIATDFREDGERIEVRLGYEAFASPPAPQENDDVTPYRLPWADRFLLVDGHRVELFHGAEGQLRQRWSLLYAIDARSRACVLHQSMQVADDWRFVSRLVLHRFGVVEASRQTAAKTITNYGAPFHAMWDHLAADTGTPAVSPLAYLFGPVLFGHYDHELDQQAPPQGYYEDRGFGVPWHLCKRGEAFGTAAIYAPTSGAALAGMEPFAARGADFHWNTAEDFHQFTHPACLAVNDAAALYSGPGGYTDFNVGELRCAYYVTGDSLGGLTGVEGVDSMYHPLWRLGKPIEVH